MTDQKPIVFISYSWDDEPHQAWVAQLATDLHSAGIEVRLDKWDTDYGDDLAQFMERSVTESHRVLMICTEPYVRKADAGKGGVGYEKMIVTGELVRDLGSKKFIPVIRHGTGDKVTPSFLATRKYVDFRDGADYSVNLASLIDSLKRSEASTKPVLTLMPEANAAEAAATGTNSTEQTAYERAMELIPRADMLGWRKLVQQEMRDFKAGALEWRRKQDASPPQVKNELPERMTELVETAKPLMTLALAGIESGVPAFTDQRALFDELVDIPTWNQGGLIVIISAPETLGFVYHCLHGAAAMQTGRPDLAINLAMSPVQRNGRSRPVYRDKVYMGWSDSMGPDCSVAWNYMYTGYSKWPWLEEIFGDEADYQRALIAYFMVLTTIEYLNALKNAADLTPGKMFLDVPPMFLRTRNDMGRRAIRYAIAAGPQLARIAGEWNVAKGEAAKRWPLWIEVLNNWGNSYDNLFMDENPMQTFLEDIGWQSRSAA